MVITTEVKIAFSLEQKGAQLKDRVQNALPSPLFPDQRKNFLYVFIHHLHGDTISQALYFALPNNFSGMPNKF